MPIERRYANFSISFTSFSVAASPNEARHPPACDVRLHGGGTVELGVAQYLAALPGRGLARATRLSHRMHLAPLIEWADRNEIVDVGSVLHGDLEGYVAWLIARRKPDGAAYAWSTHAHRLGALRMGRVRKVVDFRMGLA